MSKPPLTQARLRELLHYDPRTGLFRWRVSFGSRARRGYVVGINSPTKAGYLRVMIDGTQHYLHRLAWLYVTGEWPTGVIDHKDGNVANNRFLNLRDMTQSVNGQNRKKPRRDAVAGLPGAQWWASKGAWASTIVVNRKQIQLGKFDSAEAASKAYMKAKAKHHEGYIP